MSESEKFSPLEKAIDTAKNIFSLEEVEITLEENGEPERLLELLRGVQQSAIDDKGNITPDGEKPDLANMVIVIAQQALESFDKVSQQIESAQKKQTLAKIKGQKDFQTPKIEGAKDGATLESLSNLMVSLNGVIYGYLNKYAEKGLLTLDEMKRLGFKDEDIRKIEDSLQKKEQEEMDLWEKEDGAEKTIPLLKNLKEAFKQSPTTEKEIDVLINLIETLKSETETALVDNKIAGKKYEFVEKNYLDLAEKKIEELNEAKSVLLDDQQKIEKNAETQRAIDEFENAVKPLRDAIEAIPDDREVLGFNNPPGGPIDEERFEKQKKRLEELLENLVDQKALLMKRGNNTLKERDPGEPGASYINRELNFLLNDGNNQYDTASKRAKRLIEEAQHPPIEEMEMQDLAREIINAGKDPFYWQEWKTVGASPRLEEVRNAFIGMAVERQEGNAELEIERLVQKARVQLTALSNELQYQNEKASRDRMRLFDEMGKRIITRRELLIATTYHPEYGGAIREMLEWSFRTAALNEGEVAVEKDGKLWVMDEKEAVQNEEKIVVRYIHKMSYNQLAGENGITNLRNELAKNFPQYHNSEHKDYKPEYKQATEFTNQLFVIFDLLSISLRELQKRTKTRAHNNPLKDKDRVLLGDPLASAVHRAFRYGGNKKDWALRILTFYEDLSNSPMEYGKAKSKGHDHEKLVKLQKLLLLREKFLYGTEGFANKIPIPGFCETVGIDTYDFLTLHPPEENRTNGGDSEKLWLFDKLVDYTGKEIEGTKEDGVGFVDENLDDQAQSEDIENFVVAEENGFLQLLEKTFGKMGLVSHEEILERTKDGGQGGLLAEWIQAAGRAKMFPGRHLNNFLGPLLTHFVLGLFQSFDGKENDSLRKSLFKDVIEELEDSAIGGLDRYKVEIAGVINSLCEEDIYDTRAMMAQRTRKENPVKPGGETFVRIAGVTVRESRRVQPYKRWRLKEKLEYLVEWFRNEYHGLEPPLTALGVSMRLFTQPGQVFKEYWVGGDPRNDEFVEMAQGKLKAPDPVQQSGSLLQPEENEKKG